MSKQRCDDPEAGKRASRSKEEAETVCESVAVLPRLGSERTHQPKCSQEDDLWP